MPNVSVIVTTYNRKDQLREAIRAILNQTYQDFELIVVDNFSNYDFFAFIKEFDNDKIIPIQNKNNGVIATNRNVGVQMAKGEYIAFCDDDDIWLDEKLDKQIQILLEYSMRGQLVLTYCNTILFGDVKTEITKKKAVHSFNDFIIDNQLSFSTVVLSKSDLVRFDENINIVASEDFNLWVSLFLSDYKFVFIKEPLIRYRVSNKSMSAPNRELNSMRNILILTQHLIKFKNVKFSFLKLLYKINKDLVKYFLIRTLKKVG